ncbi:MAG: LL-diaminopimelate aminotransferase [Candidatus Omnitrophica bacterium]|nr:LL-diaminopimelate aminotransferase [Candidatus Omnitrophota bacterium]
MIEISERLKKLPPYLFAEIDRQKRQLKEQGMDLIDLGIGDPDQPTPRRVIEKLSQAAQDPANHRYALDLGMKELRQAISKWYKVRFGVRLDPDTEIQPLIGSKEGIAHMPLAFINPGEVTLVPDPCYPPYKTGTILAGGVPHNMPLYRDNAFLPDLNKIEASILKKAKLIYLNYPNNPTGAVCPEDYLKMVIKFACKNNLLVCYDAAYSEISFDGYRAPSFLQFDGSRDLGIEFHSLSKTYNMTGWRIGWACGNKEAVAALGKVKTNIDSGIFQAVQIAGITALEGDQAHIDRMNKIYEDRRDCLIRGLERIGWKIEKPKATFYVWAPLPKGQNSSIDFAKLLLEKANVVATPGVGFGVAGEGYIRFAMTAREERIKEAVERIGKVL